MKRLYSSSILSLLFCAISSAQPVSADGSFKSVSSAAGSAVAEVFAQAPSQTPTPSLTIKPTPPQLANPQNPISYGADPTGRNDSSAAFNKAAIAGDVEVPTGSFLINGDVSLGSRNMRCEPGAILNQTVVAEHFMFNARGAGSVFNCHFRGPYTDVSIPSYNLFPEDFIHLTPPSDRYQIVGNDFNGSGGWTEAIDVYASNRQQPPPTNFIIGWNTFEHCSYYATQVTSGTNGQFIYNKSLDCAGWIEADNTGQANTGNVARGNHFTFVNGTGWTNHGGGKWASEFTCGSDAGGKPYDYSGNICENNMVDGPYGSRLQESPDSMTGLGVGAVYIGETCTGGCTVH
jgi:hypothetical protein